MRLLVARTDRSLLDQQNTPVHDILPDDVVYFVDWYSRDWLTQKIDQLGRPSLIVCDVEASLAPQPVPQVFIPEMRGGIFRRHRSGMTSVVDLTDRSVDTVNCFNFSINKKSHDRFILLKLVQWFNLTSYQYTWSGSGNVMDMAPIVINRTFRYRCPEGNGSWQNMLAQADIVNNGVFVGTTEEHEDFVKVTGFAVKYYPVKNFKEMADIIAGADLFMGNQSAAYSIAMGLGKASVLETIKIKPLANNECYFPRDNCQYF